MAFYYVYILQSELIPHRYYSGLTDDLRDRLRRHNAGEVTHTLKYRPWRIKTAMAFTDRARAAEFERHLKSAFGTKAGHDRILTNASTALKAFPTFLSCWRDMSG